MLKSIFVHVLFYCLLRHHITWVACHHPFTFIRFSWNLACGCDGEQPIRTEKNPSHRTGHAHPWAMKPLLSLQSWCFGTGLLQVPCACGGTSRKVLVPWPKGLQGPNSVARSFAKSEQEGLSPLSEKQGKSSSGSTSLHNWVPYEFYHARVTQTT